MIWLIFVGFIIVALVLDLGVFNKNAHKIQFKEAAAWTTVWVSCAVLFTGIVFLAFSNEWIENPTELTPHNAAVKYITGYLIELSLSVDNIFVIALIFSSFKIPDKYQHEVLFYGVIGAVVFRALMIFFGVALIHKFSFIIYAFGAFLLYTAIKMLFSKHTDYDPRETRVFRWFSKIYPVTHEVEGDHFFVVKDGIKMATPLLLALIIIEFSDIFFAVDSIPAILGVTTDPFIVFTSNILAVMGLRSMYFLISGMLGKFTYINYSLVVILGFVGVKMILHDIYDFPEWLSLSVIVLSLAGGITASALMREPEKMLNQHPRDLP